MASSEFLSPPLTLPALGTLFQQHAGTCFGVAKQLLRDEQRSADAVRQAFVSLWRDQERGARDVGCWLALETHRQALERLRHDPARSDAALPSPTTRGAILNGLGEQAQQVLRRIPSLEREALVLSFWGGFTAQEISTITGDPLSLVRSRCQAALRKLGTLTGSAPPFQA